MSNRLITNLCGKSCDEFRGKSTDIASDLCTRNKKVFTHEHDLFSPAELRRHEKFGDDNPGAVDQSGFKGHPECGFCRQRFYGDDELYAHCRDKHERCHICDRRAQGSQPQYFVNYDSLEAHFRKEHFLCSEKECLDKKFIVFESEIDLKAHQLQVHPGGFSKDARKDARRIDMAGFDYRTPHLPERNHREGRGRGRGRDPNTESLPQSTAQPLRRDEIAYQRQMAIQSSQSVTPRTFGGRLTNHETSIRPPTTNSTSTTAHPPSLSSLEIQDPNPQQDTPQDQARALRHAAVTSRAATLLHKDPLKLNTFRSSISSYRTSVLSADSLLDSFFSLFGCPPTELGKLIRDLADIFEDDAKRNDLLKSWNDWRAINEDYPALPGPGGVIPGMSSGTMGNGGKRLLNLKNSTTQSSQSPVSRSQSWASSSKPNGHPLPALPSSSTSNWSSRANGQSTNSHSTPVSATLRTTPLRVKPIASSNAEAFPALPSSSKPSTSFGYGLSGRGSARSNPWSGNSSSDVNAAASETEGEDMLDAGLKKKKAGKKKQILFHYG